MNNEPDAYTLCPHCKNNVLSRNFLLHEVQCEKQQKNRVIIEEVLPQKKKESIPAKKESIIEEYTCPNCEMKLKIEQIETHESICEQRPTICQFCKEEFPFSLMSFHQDQCNNHPQEVENNNNDNQNHNEMELEPNNQPAQEEEVKEVINNGTYTRTEIRRLPNGSLHHVTMVYNGNNPNFRSTTSFMTSNISNMNNNSNTYANVNRNNDGNAIRNQVNSFSTFNQNNNNRDQFDNFNNFFADFSSRFPRGFAIRPLMNNNFNINELPFFLSQLPGNANQGLSKEERESFENYPFAKRAGLSNEDLKCVICYSDFVDKEQIRCLPCFHKFHVDCIDTWLEKNSKCPVCKYDLLKEFGRENEGDQE